MKNKTASVAAGLVLASMCQLATAQDPNIFVPPSSQTNLFTPIGQAHTNHLILVQPARFDWGSNPMQSRASVAGYQPSQLEAAYGARANGGSQAIAIVDAYGYATALNDFNVFASMFNLPKETSSSATASTNKVFEVVYASGKTPAVDGGWDEEQALDIEWAHALAPYAKIYLVEAASSSFGDLFSAISVASKLPGVKQVSMSWGAQEFGGEQGYDGEFGTPGVTYFASAGDVAAVPEYPAAASTVIGVGGTSLTLSKTSTYNSESVWSSTGGGPSKYESRPSFQAAVAGLTSRGTPDIAADANPYTGCAVYDSTKYEGYGGWMVFGGTSLACPICAGLANAEGSFRGGSELTWVYSNKSSFHDITTGASGIYPAKVGWDFCTGWGSPKSPAAF